MKPVDLILRSIRPTIINSYVIEKIEIDLKHVNYGLDPVKGYGRKARSSFEAEDILRFFESLNGLEIGFEATATGNTSLWINRSSRSEKSTVWFFALTVMNQVLPEL